MQFKALSVLAVAACASAQSTNTTAFLAGLAQALQSADLRELATAAASINGTAQGQALIGALASNSSNFTIFAPTDVAFRNVSSSTTSNASELASILSYHVARGDYSGLVTPFPNNTIIRTLLNDSELVQLEGNKSQVIALTNMSGTLEILDQPTNVTSTNMTKYQGITIMPIDAVLQPPRSLVPSLEAANFTQLPMLLGQAMLPNSSMSLEAMLNGTDLHGFTLFAPNDVALQAAASTLSGISSNATALATVLGNHLINGTTAYSPSLVSNASKYTSASGEPFTFVTNTTGAFVTSGNASAKITRSDILVSNGVVHVIDGVLANSMENPSAASSAYASATSVAAVLTTETAPVGAPTSSSSSGQKSGAVKLSDRCVWAMLTAVGCAFAGAAMTLV